ncbi:MAG: glycosyltransferase family 2 protein [Clostridia bacterium]|nr:glycosyltransferase family 2 protein [Clostridia bacterium]
MKLSVVIPCYNEEGNVRPLLEACVATFKDLSSFELIFVNDGSRDGTWAALKELYAQRPCAMKLVNFSRNFGKEAAMYAGMQKASGEYVSLLDADLQQSPQIVLDMVEFLDLNPDYDCVAAYQETRHEGKFTTWCKKTFYRMMDRICDISLHEGASDFRTFRRGVAESILSVKECYRFSKGIFSWVGFNTHFIPYEAQERHSGATNWSFWKLLKYALDGIISYTTFPLKVSTFTGGLMALLSLIYMVVVVVQKLAFGIDIPGYPTIIVLILLIGGLQMITLGIIGEYIARIYIQGKHRPLYIAKEYLSTQEEGEQDAGHSL